MNALTYAADCLIPSKRVNFFNYWWDEEAEAFKKASINSHKIWKENGRPRDGPLYEMKTKINMPIKTICVKKSAMSIIMFQMLCMMCLSLRIKTLFGKCGIINFDLKLKHLKA